MCQEVNPADTNLVVKCCKLLVKVMPKLGINEKDHIKNIISWVLLCVIESNKHEYHSEQMNEILLFYACAIQAYENLNINDTEVRNNFWFF